MTLWLAAIVFICIFGGALLGVLAQSWLPRHHLEPESRGRDIFSSMPIQIFWLSALIHRTNSILIFAKNPQQKPLRRGRRL